MRYRASSSFSRSLLVITLWSSGNIRSFLARCPPEFMPLSQTANSDWSSIRASCSSAGRGEEGHPEFTEITSSQAGDIDSASSCDGTVWQFTNIPTDKH